MTTAAGSQGVTIWLTGLSGAGKTTIAHVLERRLHAAGHHVELLDGDVVRTHLSAGLGFSKADRDANVLRIGWVCQLLNRHGVDAIVAAISPYRATRDAVRAQIPHFVEVYVDCPLDVLTDRDPKGLYRRARAGEMAHFTGISDPYEPPLKPAVICRTDGAQTPEECAANIVAELAARGLVRSGSGSR